MQTQNKFDVIVIGGGHAGTEAALASARLHARTLLITHNIDTLGQMSCNPAIGGIGKGHLVKEIDALGGVMAKAIDHAGIQFRVLNASKGPAVRATRAQADRVLYRNYIRQTLEQTPYLSIFQQSVDDLLLTKGEVSGVVTQSGICFHAKTVVLTAGTFLNGKVHIGLESHQAGRAGDAPSIRLAAKLAELKLPVGRLKTGTPARLDQRSIDFSLLQAQAGDEPMPCFSFEGTPDQHPAQRRCHITHTNAQTHEIIQAAMMQSPLYNGTIDGVGPRYCPSIEDKVVRFSDRDSHQVFLEPEGLTSIEYYPNGISTSLPYEIQVKFIHSIKGLGSAVITRPGYAIEYDYFDPRMLNATLETQSIKGLFFAGQINGTTGYEEAAAQGLLAGANAALQAQGKQALTFERSNSYLGVMVDDLTTLGTQEPYRMFTSRAEHRLLLREDNADLRLMHQAHEVGLIDHDRMSRFELKRQLIEMEKQRLADTWISPEKIAESSRILLGGRLSQATSLEGLLKRPEHTYHSLSQMVEFDPPDHLPKAVLDQVETQIKYAGYIQRQFDEIKKQTKQEHSLIPEALDYEKIKGLSNEVRQKLIEQQPKTIGQAGRIPGVTPAAISILMVAMKQVRGSQNHA